MPGSRIAYPSFLRSVPRRLLRGDEWHRQILAAPTPQAQASQHAQQDEFWHDHYHLQSYYVNGRGYDQYRPAYQLGWTAAQQNSADLATVMPLLEAQWSDRSGASLLAWRQVSSAVQAAWERVRYAEPAIDLSQVQLQSLLQALQRLNLQAAKCLRIAVVQVPAGLLQQMLQRHLQNFEAASAELLQEFALPINDKGGWLFSGTLQRSWESIKAAIGPQGIQSLLDACEEAERMLLLVYRAALRERLPQAARVLLQRQAMAVQRGIEALHWLRSYPTV